MSPDHEATAARVPMPAAEKRHKAVLVFGRGLVSALVLMTAAGAAAFAVAILQGQSARAWQAYLVNLLVWLGVAQGAVVASAAFYLTQGRWAGSAAYRLAEAFVGFIPAGFVLFWGLYFGRATIFPWVLHPIAQKAAWLNTTFLFARDGLALALMTALSLWFVRASRRPEVCKWAEFSGDIVMPPAAVRRLSPAVALCYVVVYSLIAFDLVMSLAPVWRSTLFGAYFFAGAFWSGLTAIALAAVLLGRRLGPGNRFAKPQVLHDLGKLVFAFSVFWVYLLFAQYLVIWYANIPVETFFVVQRVNHLPWAPLSWTALAFIWAIPFVFLLGARPKRTPVVLGAVAAVGLVGISIERYVLVVPSLSPRVLPFGWIELLITLGFMGVFLLCSMPGLNLAARSALEGGSTEAGR